MPINCPSCGHRWPICKAPIEPCPGVALRAKDAIERATQRDAKAARRRAGGIPRGWYLLAAVAVSCCLWAAILIPTAVIITKV